MSVQFSPAPPAGRFQGGSAGRGNSGYGGAGPGVAVAALAQLQQGARGGLAGGLGSPHSPLASPHSPLAMAPHAVGMPGTGAGLPAGHGSIGAGASGESSFADMAEDLNEIIERELGPVVKYHRQQVGAVSSRGSRQAGWVLSAATSPLAKAVAWCQLVGLVRWQYKRIHLPTHAAMAVTGPLNCRIWATCECASSRGCIPGCKLRLQQDLTA